MREAYNHLRGNIGLVIRDLEEMRAADGGVLDALSLDALKLQAKEDQEQVSQTVTRLLGKQAITPAMGTSLINDSGFAYAISLNLIVAAETLFVSSERDLSQAAHDVMLDESELLSLQERQTGA